jgi:hypothetical protein
MIYGTVVLWREILGKKAEMFPMGLLRVFSYSMDLAFIWKGEVIWQCDYFIQVF